MKKITNIMLQIALLAGVWAFIAAYQAVGTFFFSDRYYAFRAYEVALAPPAQGMHGPFQPYFVWDAPSSGDLSHMAGVPQLFQRHRERFTTDEYGFRNPVGTLDRPCDVVVVGDSFGIGAGASDDEILSGVIRSRTGLSVYNYCGINLSLFFCDQRFRKQPPKLVILFFAERGVTPLTYGYSAPVIDSWLPAKRAAGDVTPKRPYQDVRSAGDFYAELNNPRLLRHHAETVYKGFLYAVGLYRFPPEIFWYDRPTRMFFYAEGGNRHLTVPAAMKDADAALEGLRKWRDELTRRGTRMLVLIGPDKETIYSDRVPQLKGRNDTHALLDYFFGELEKAGIDCVRTHEVLTAYRNQHPDELLYFADDTHMTPVTQEVLFDALKDRLPPY